MTIALIIVGSVLVVGLVVLLVTLLTVERRAMAGTATLVESTGRGNVSDVLKRIRRLEIKVKHLVDESFAGSYHSVFKGQGMNFEEVREYQQGDEIRSIDWNVTARLSEPYVKVFTEERELTLVLVVDLSASGNYGSDNFSKREIAAEIAATLAFSAIGNNDRVALRIAEGLGGNHRWWRVRHDLSHKVGTGWQWILGVALPGYQIAFLRPC